MAKIRHYEEIEEKSKKFLIDILGKELSDKFFEEGKIEIKSGGNTYQLYSSGKIINKTTNHIYCIVPTSPGLPIYDIIAIKFAWLKYGLEIVEKVANKTSIDYIPTSTTESQRVNGEGYEAFIHYMEQSGWRRELIILNEHNTRFVSTNHLNADYTGDIVNIRCPAGLMMTTKGVLYGTNDAYTISLYVTDKDGKEINNTNRIKIEKIKPSEEVIQLARIFYVDIRNKYRWRHSFVLNGQEHLRIFIVNPDVEIGDVKINIDFDLWVRRQ